MAPQHSGQQSTFVKHVSHTVSGRHGKITVASFASQASLELENRKRLRGWIAPVERDLLRGFVALGRSFEREPEQGAAGALLGDAALDELISYLFGRLHRCRPATLLGRAFDPGSPLHLFVAAELEEHAARIEKEIAATDPERFVREAELRLSVLTFEGAYDDEGWRAVFHENRGRLPSLARRARGTAAAGPLRQRLEAARPGLRGESRGEVDRALARLAP